jgi:hypothetical protein
MADAATAAAMEAALRAFNTQLWSLYAFGKQPYYFQQLRESAVGLDFGRPVSDRPVSDDFQVWLLLS